MLAAPLRIYLNRYAVLVGRELVVLFTNDNDAYGHGARPARGGRQVTVVDLRPKPVGRARCPGQTAGIAVFRGHGLRSPEPMVAFACARSAASRP